MNFKAAKASCRININDLYNRQSFCPFNDLRVVKFGCRSRLLFIECRLFDICRCTDVASRRKHAYATDAAAATR